jgi:hypothetical protein
MTTNTIELPVSAIVFREDLYPRLGGRSAETVQKYAEDLEILPPIEVNQHNELIDGWHRWTAHRKVEAATIKVFVTPTANEGEFIDLALVRNATHGLQLSQDDKREMARKIYHATPDRDREEKKRHLAKILSVSERTVRRWLSRLDEDSKDARNRRIFDMWLACYTQEEIAAAAGCTRDEARGALKFGENGQLSEFPKGQQAAASHATDFEIPLYNVWKQQPKTAGSGHFVDNLLYLYTQPFDVVVDPFGGGGSTIDICRKRLRRYWVSDRKPVVEREQDIRKHDLTTGLPPLPRWKDVRLVYLDPPPEQSSQTLAGIINGFAKKLEDGAVIALLSEPTQSPEGRWIDHFADTIHLVKLPIDMCIKCPHDGQQYTPQMVEWARDNRKMLTLLRELVIWRVA